MNFQTMELEQTQALQEWFLETAAAAISFLEKYD